MIAPMTGKFSLFHAYSWSATVRLNSQYISDEEFDWISAVFQIQLHKTVENFKIVEN